MSAQSDSFVYADPPPSAALREHLRQLIRDHLPERWLGPFTNDPKDLEISREFCAVLAAEGLLVPNWPVEYGGQDLDLALSVVIREEMWAAFEPRAGQYYGPNWIGPSIMQYGTAVQKQLHLPLIASGKVIWCQGFSEPDAGSDLASLRTRAVPDGDGFRITGQKIWTSWALWADWCYLLARLDGTQPGSRDGITVFLVPMDRDGITVRGLDGLPGPHHLNEVFLDSVYADSTEVLGGVGEGWRIIRDALSHERIGIARYARGDRLLAAVEAHSPPTGSARARWMEARVRNRMARLMCRRALWLLDQGGSHDFMVSATRMVTTRADLLAADALSGVVGEVFFEDRYTPDAAFAGAVEGFWRYMQAGTIASGTTEMLQRQLARLLFRGERIRVTDGLEDVRSSIDRLVSDKGGIGLTRECIADPDRRRDLLSDVEGMIESLDPRDGRFEGAAAAELCRGAGYGALPVPIEGLLLRRASGHPLAFASPKGRYEHADLFPEWEIAGVDGTVTVMEPPTGLIGSKVGPFVSLMAPTPLVSAEPLSDPEHALLLLLPSWYILGALERALDLAVRYASDRVAFGAPIASYQGVSFPLADACSELQGLYELGIAALHSIYESPAAAVVDALACRWAALDIGRRVLRSAHQVLGALGQCDEHDLAILTLSLQARLRIPTDADASMDALCSAVDQRGFESIFNAGSAGLQPPTPVTQRSTEGDHK